MIDGSAIKEISKLKEEGMIFQIDGKSFSPVQMKMIFDEPKPAPLIAGTLSGLVDYLGENKDNLEKENLVIQIKDHANVYLYGKIEGEDLHRKCFFHVSLDDCFKNFQFGTYLEHEDFIIKLRSLFVENNTLAELIAFASSVTMTDEGTNKDNGISQVVSVKRGISGALKENVTAPAVVNLIPYRTFREVDQVESEFLFRLKTLEGKIPTCALFESDGGTWRIKAVLAIKEWLGKKIEQVSIIA